MNKSFILLLAFAYMFFVGCSRTEKNYVAKVKLQSLTRENMFDKDMVYDVIFDAEEQNLDSLKKESQQVFLKAIDAYKNKKDISEGIALLIKSILIFPNAKSYYELGNAKTDYVQLHPELRKAYLKDAIDAYEVAEKLNFEPLSKVYYKQACTYNIMDEDGDQKWETYNALKNAFQNGFSDTTLLKSEKNLYSFLGTKEYKELMTDIRNKRWDNKTLSPFELFARAFPNNSSDGFEILTEEVALEGYDQSISYDFSEFVPEMQNANFGRDVSHDFMYVAKVAETVNYKALIYASVSYYGEEMQPIHVSLVTYDQTGQIISSLLFSGQFSAEKIKTGKIEDGKITVQDFKRTWKYPIDEKPFEENEVLEYETISKATFIIDDNGKIKEDVVPENYVDTVSIVKN